MDHRNKLMAYSDVNHIKVDKGSSLLVRRRELYLSRIPEPVSGSPNTIQIVMEYEPIL